MKFQCHVCSKAYAWEHDLKRHLKVKHDSVEQLQQQLYGTSQQQQQQQQQEFGTFQQQQQEFGTSPQQQQEFDTSQQQQQQQQELGTFQQQQQQELSTSQQQQKQEFSTFQQRHNEIPMTQQRDDFTFKHPFTCVISGPTSCGKTYFMVQLLQLARHKIQPPPERIIWLYKRWQPLYDVISKSVLPKVEFMKGIPLNIDRDDFIDPMVRNVIVLDDLALEASKDQRVTDLFTEGSHHRNLSVIALNQNLYISKDPTQRRNCHYLVLYNNPIDKQIITTLAKQMYPTNPKALIRHFDDAVSKPFGYLLLDLKPYTPETARMRTNVLDIKRAEKLDKNHSPTNIQTSNKVAAIIENEVKNSSLYGTDYFDKRDKMTSCDDCGVMLQNTHDLQNHVKRWCPEAVHWTRLSPANESTPNKRARYDESDTEEDVQNSEKNEHESEVYLAIASKVREQNEGKWQKKVEKYLEQGMSDSEAEERANMKLKQDDVNAFMDRYATLIEYMLKLNGGYLHTKIISMVERLMERDISQERAIQMALRKYNHYFEEYIDTSDDQSDTEYDSNNENEDNSDNVMTDEVIQNDERQFSAVCGFDHRHKLVFKYV